VIFAPALLLEQRLYPLARRFSAAPRVGDLCSIEVHGIHHRPSPG
jgi:hypothetical protein